MVTCADKTYSKRINDKVLSESYRQGVIFLLIILQLYWVSLGFYYENFQTGKFLKDYYT